MVNLNGVNSEYATLAIHRADVKYVYIRDLCAVAVSFKTPNNPSL